jgi:hypothetical protein
MRLDHSTISQRIDTLPWGEVERTHRGAPNAAWSTAGRINELLILSAALDTPVEERVVFPLGPLNQSIYPSWKQDKALPERDDPQVELCRKALAEGNVIHVIHEGVPIKTKDGIRESGSFHLVLKNASVVDDAEAHFYRGQISLPLNLNREPGAPGIASLLIVKADCPLEDLLRESEGPAHMKWNTTEPSLNEKYHWGPSTIRLLNNAVKAVMEVLRSEATEAEDFLNDLFGLKSIRQGTDDDDDQVIMEQIERPLYLNPRISNHEHGYTIKGRPEAGDLTGRRYVVRVGYNKPHPNPLIPNRAPDPRVFDIDGMYHATTGAQVEPVISEDGEICPDRFMLTIEEEEFEVEIEGLDLQLKAKAIATLFEGRDD